jgi:hypothetical protein
MPNWQQGVVGVVNALTIAVHYFGDEPIPRND